MKGTAFLLSFMVIVFFSSSIALCLVDLNTASQSELESLPGITPLEARRIIDGRPYENINDLMHVSGIGKDILDDIRQMVTVGVTEQADEPTPRTREGSAAGGERRERRDEFGRAPNEENEVSADRRRERGEDNESRRRREN